MTYSIHGDMWLWTDKDVGKSLERFSYFQPLSISELLLARLHRDEWLNRTSCIPSNGNSAIQIQAH